MTGVIVASGNGASAVPTGIRILARGGSALDAVEACAKIIEADTTDTSVGRGGKPNVLGEVELDASIMDGTTHRSGAVAALKGYLHPISVAPAVTTSGWAYKYPGRIGDSPVIGAGNFCDSQIGAAACTGYGELAIRSVTAKTAVDRLAGGMPVDLVARAAIADANALEDAAFNIVVLSAKGAHASATNRDGRRYVWMTVSMHEPRVTPRRIVRARDPSRSR